MKHAHIVVAAVAYSCFELLLFLLLLQFVDVGAVVIVVVHKILLEKKLKFYFAPLPVAFRFIRVFL